MKSVIQKIAHGSQPANSLRWRITLWTVLASLTLQAGLAALLAWYQRGMMDQIATRRLEMRADLLARDLAAGRSVPDSQDLSALAGRYVVPLLHEDFMAAFYDGEGRRVAWAGGGAGPELLPSDVRSGTVAAGRRVVPGLKLDGDEDPADRVFVRPVSVGSAGAGWLIIASSDALFEEGWSLLVRLLAAAVPVAVLGTGLASWLISGIAIPPLVDLKRITSAMLPETIRQDVGVQKPPVDLEGFQRDLIDVRARLRESFRAQDRLIAHLSHELKTPIAVLLVEASTLRAETLSPEALEFVESVRQEMRRLAGLVESFIILSRAQSGQRLPTHHRCDLGALVHDATLACAEPASARGVAVSTRFDADPTDLSTHGDPEMLRLLIQHLVRAAITASPPGQTVEVRVSSGQDTCAVTIADRGEPIPEDQLGTVFDWFTEAHPHRVNRRSPDLAIARAIAELHGGSITVRNGDAGGCVFLAEFPLHAEARTSQPA